MLNIFEQISCY